MAMPYIPKETIDSIQATVSIEEVINATGYKLIGTGRSKGVEQCPLCGRDHTHIKLNTRKNLFNCHSISCGFAGNQFHWIMEVEKLSFQEAVKRVADIGGITLQFDENEQEQEKQNALKEAVNFYKSCLPGRGEEYLKGRGFIKETIEVYKMGFAPGGAELKNHLNSKGYSNDFLLEIGLIRLVQGKKLMDRFYNSIIIPDLRENRIFDLYGRSIDPNMKSKHIYLDGTKTMLGWNTVSPNKYVFVSEAPIDAASNFQLTGTAAFATGGTEKFDKFHIYHIKSSKLIPIFAYDNDPSGRKATVEAIHLLEEYGIEESYVLDFGEYKDTNDLLKNGGKNSDLKLIKSKTFVYEYQLAQMPLGLIERYLNRQKSGV